jgi:general secretion pathway protein C
MQNLSTFLEMGDSTKQWSNRVATLTAAVVIIAIVQVLATMTWQVAPAVPSPQAPVREQAGFRTVMDRGPAVSEQLTQSAPFGRAEKRSKPVPARVVVPETRLDLELKGVIAGKDGKSGGAIIADKKDGDRYFAVGATLPGGVVLDEVHPQQVVLLRNGRQEVLKLPKASLDGTQPESPKALGRHAGSSQRRVSLASGRSGSSGRAGRPSGMKRAIRIRPLFRGGRIKGFRVSPGRDRKLFATMGFKAGDLLVRINGMTPKDPKEIFSVLQKLNSAGGVTVEVTRRGRPVTLTLGGQ